MYVIPLIQECLGAHIPYWLTDLRHLLLVLSRWVDFKEVTFQLSSLLFIIFPSKFRFGYGGTFRWWLVSRTLYRTIWRLWSVMIDATDGLFAKVSPLIQLFAIGLSFRAEWTGRSASIAWRDAFPKMIDQNVACLSIRLHWCSNDDFVRLRTCTYIYPGSYLFLWIPSQHTSSSQDGSTGPHPRRCYGTNVRCSLSRILHHVN